MPTLPEVEIYPTIFEKCMKVIFAHEGGYVNDPLDLGGETNRGICKRYFPAEDIKNLTQDRAKYLYFHFYWTKLNIMGLSRDIDILNIFDFAVNAGRTIAIKTAQRVVHVKPDGIMGVITRDAINGFTGFSEHYKEARKEYYVEIVRKRPKNQKFLKGWLNRVDSTHF